MVKSRHRFGEQCIGGVAIVVNGGQTHTAMRTKRAHHVKDYA
jgi:hypothetical protein